MSDNTGDFEEEIDPLEQGSDDPFSAENAPMLNFIMQARIYDVLVAILSSTDKKLSDEILRAHANGAIIGPMPSFSGNFIFDEINATDESTGTTGE